MSFNDKSLHQQTTVIKGGLIVTKVDDDTNVITDENEELTNKRKIGNVYDNPTESIAKKTKEVSLPNNLLNSLQDPGLKDYFLQLQQQQLELQQQIELQQQQLEQKKLEQQQQQIEQQQQQIEQLQQLLYQKDLKQQISPISQDGIKLFIERYLHNINTNLTIENFKQSSAKLISSFGHNFPFVGRDETQQTITKVYQTYLTSFVNKPFGQMDKTKIEIPFIAAAPGIGKTKILKEIGLHLFEKCETIPLFVTFGNGCTASNIEKSNIEGVMNALAIRIIYSIVALFDIDTQFNTISNSWYKYLNGQIVELDDILSVCESVLKLKKDSIFYIAIDEVHIVDTTSNSKSDHPLRSLLSLLGQCMNRKKICALLAGTYHTVIEDNLIGSTYTPKYIPLPARMSTNDLNYLLDSLKFPKLTNWRTNSTFRHYLRTFGGLMRGVESFIEHFVTTNETEKGSWELANTFLKAKYIRSFPMPDELLKCVLTRKLIIKTQLIGEYTFSQLENYGYIMLDPFDNYFIPVYSTILLKSLLIDSDLRKLFEKLFLNHDSKIYGFGWEDVIYDFLYLFLSLLPESSLTLNQVFPFGNMNSSTKETQFHIPKAKLQFLSPKKIEGKHTTNYLTFDSKQYEVIESTETGLVIKNATGSKAGDVLLFGFLKSTVFHIQCKWADSESKSLPYSEITKEIEKNSQLQFKSETNNITVIITGKSITDLPDTLPNNLIIICKDNFANYFGVFSEQMRFLSSSHLLHINECSEAQLKSFAHIGVTKAKCIVDTRGVNTLQKNYEIIY